MSTTIVRRAIPPAREAANRVTIDALSVAVNELSGAVGTVPMRAVRIAELLDAGILTFTAEGALELNPVIADVLEQIPAIVDALDAIDGKLDADAVEAGTYAPIFTLVTNASAATSPVGLQFMRINKGAHVVTCSGQVNITPNAVGLVEVQANLPVASDFIAFGDCAGVGATSSGSTRVPVSVNGDPTTNKMRIIFDAATTFTHVCTLQLTYLVR